MEKLLHRLPLRCNAVPTAKVPASLSLAGLFHTPRRANFSLTESTECQSVESSTTLPS